MLEELDQLPPGLLETPSDQLHDHLGGPTLIHLPGRRPAPLFVSVLMHGNETVGWDAMRSLLQKYRPGGGDRPLPRALSLFLGNTAAARQGVRRLPGQPDYNRVWPGSELPPTPEHAMMARIVQSMARRRVFASIDLHNNTGLNPHYACVNALDAPTLHLATLFSRTVVYFLRPKGVQSIAMTRLCPAVTLECGKVGQQRGVEHAAQFVDACLHLDHHPRHPVADHDLDLFHTVAVVKVPATVTFGFGPHCGHPLCLPETLERLNFNELPAGTSFGWVSAQAAFPLEVRDEADRNVADRYFTLADGELRTKVPLMPSMLTRDQRVIRQDCLGYLMERYPLHTT